MSSFPDLSLLEEFLLFALDDETGDFYPIAPRVMNCATAAAVLMQLALKGRIDNDLTSLFVVDTAPTGDGMLDAVLRNMSLSPILTPQPIVHWIEVLAEESQPLQETALKRLEARKIIRREDKKLLWFFGTRHYPALSHEPQREVRSRLFDILLRDYKPYPEDVMLLALIDRCHLLSRLMPPDDYRMAEPRLRDLVKMDLIAQAMARAIDDVEKSIAVAPAMR